MTNTRPRDSCREVFRNMEIMTLCSQYIFSLILCRVNNKHLFNTNNQIYKYISRYNNNLHLPLVNLSKFDKGAYIPGAKAFNHLPHYIKTLANDQKRYKFTLNRFLYHHSFYSMDECYECKEAGRVWTTSADITVCWGFILVISTYSAVLYFVFTDLSVDVRREGEWMNEWVSE
jgi:hypothetical protein